MKQKIIILGAGESGVGAALLAKKKGYDVFVSDGTSIKEIYKSDSSTIYSAIWSDGPLYYNEKKYGRKKNKKVSLKCLYNTQNIVNNEFLNEVWNFF